MSLALFPNRFIGFGSLPPGANSADAQYEAIYTAAKAAVDRASTSGLAIFSDTSQPGVSAWSELVNLLNELSAIDLGQLHLSDNGGWAPTVADEVRQRTARVLAYLPASGEDPPPQNPIDPYPLPPTVGTPPVPDPIVATIDPNTGGVVVSHSRPATGGGGHPSLVPDNGFLGATVASYFTHLATTTGLSISTLELLALLLAAGGVWYMMEGKGRR